MFPSLFQAPIATVKVQQKKKCKVGGGRGEECEREKEAEGHLCNQPQPDTSTVITGTLKNLHLAFKSLIGEPLKGRLKSKTDHQTLKVCSKSLRQEAAGKVHPAPRQQRRARGASSRIQSGQQFETCPCLLFHYGKATREPVCWPNTINKVSAAHQYCYLHRVLICSPYNHKMLIAPINSQSVCALVWPP